MELIKADIDNAIKEAKKYQDFVDILSLKGYYIKRNSYYLSVSSPYYNRNIRLARAFGENYTFDNIKSRIYHNGAYKMDEIEDEKVYKVKIYDGIKIDSVKLQTSTFYRLYVHYLYLFGKLPPKIHYEERTKEYYKEIDNFQKLCDELNMIGDYDLKSVNEVQNLRVNYLDEVAPLKAERENVRRIYNRTTNSADKCILEARINVLAENIDKINSKIQTCKRIINKAEKGEKEDLLIQRRLEENQLKNEKENNKNKKLDRAF